MRTLVEQLGLTPEEQISALGDFILRLECGWPRCDAEHPNGMGAVESAIMYIHELRSKLFALQATEHELINARKELAQLKKYTNELERDYKKLEKRVSRYRETADNVTEDL